MSEEIEFIEESIKHLERKKYTLQAQKNTLEELYKQIESEQDKYITHLMIEALNKQLFVIEQKTEVLITIRINIINYKRSKHEGRFEEARNNITRGL